MKKVIIFIFLLANVCAVRIKAQTTQDFLNSCVEDEREKGAEYIIVNANLCSVCMSEPTFEGRLFIKDSTDTYKVRYVKYVNGYSSVKILKDSTYTDLNVQEIFKIVESHQDSIFSQLKNMNSLLTIKIIKDGKTMYREPLMHGKMRYMGMFYGEKSATAINSIISLNNVFERAYYYWLLSSSINNYVNDLHEP